MTTNSDKINAELSIFQDHAAGALGTMDGMASWDTRRRESYVKTINERSNTHAVLTMLEVGMILEMAQSRHFISDKHVNEVRTKTAKAAFQIGSWESALDYRQYRNHGYAKDYHGRSYEELNSIAKERATLVCKNLPRLADAVRVIDSETADKIDRAKKLREQLDAHSKTMEGLCKTIIISEYAKEFPDTTMASFVKMVEDRTSAAEKLSKTMDEISTEGSKLQKEIDKALYDGLPGLSEAVVDLCVEKINTVGALPQMMRRVSETVLFGDSAEALTMLQTFEKDEVRLEGDIADKFKAAMDKLKDAAKALKSGGTTAPKQLAKGKTKRGA